MLYFIENASAFDGGAAATLALSSEKDEGVVGRRGTQIKTSDGIADTTTLPIETDLDGEDTFFEQELVRIRILVLLIHYSPRNQSSLYLKCCTCLIIGHHKKMNRW